MYIMDEWQQTKRAGMALLVSFFFFFFFFFFFLY